MKIVQEINGCKIEEREHNNHKYYVIWCGRSFNKAYSLQEAIELAYIITRKI